MDGVLDGVRVVLAEDLGLDHDAIRRLRADAVVN
jgi:hypothetical protein